MKQGVGWLAADIQINFSGAKTACFPRPRCEREVRVPLHTYCLIGFPGGVGDEGLAETLKKTTRFPWATEGVRQTDQTDLRYDCSDQGSYK